jgi:hypothetical protein
MISLIKFEPYEKIKKDILASPHHFSGKYYYKESN